MTSDQTEILDLVCKRYPGTKPSDYLDIDDPVVALQVDFAVAYKHRIEDFKHEGTFIEAIDSMLQPIGQALGVSYKKTAPKGQDPKAMPDDLPVEDVLKMIGGKGMMVNHRGK